MSFRVEFYTFSKNTGTGFWAGPDLRFAVSTPPQPLALPNHCGYRARYQCPRHTSRFARHTNLGLPGTAAGVAQTGRLSAKVPCNLPLNAAGNQAVLLNAAAHPRRNAVLNPYPGSFNTTQSHSSQSHSTVKALSTSGCLSTGLYIVLVLHYCLPLLGRMTQSRTQWPTFSSMHFYHAASTICSTATPPSISGYSSSGCCKVLVLHFCLT